MADLLNPLQLIALAAQCFFSARVLVQWIASERARRVLSPKLFWVLSLAGSWLLMVYGWLRCDFAIVAGQLVAYYIYIWNLRAKGVLNRSTPRWVYWLLHYTPLVVLGWVVTHNPEGVADAFFNDVNIPLALVVFGTAAQLVFASRFIYQWWYSRRLGVSELPLGFWLISLGGSLMLLAYFIVRLDLVMILSQVFGLITYSRNLVILKKQSVINS